MTRSDAAIESAVRGAKDVKDGTKENYMRYLRRAARLAGATMWDILTKPEAHWPTIAQQLTETSKKTMAATMLAVIKHARLTTDGVKEKWSAIYESAAEGADAAILQSEPRKPNAVIEWEEVVGNYDRLVKEQPDGSVDRLLSGFYVLMPPRRQLDYAKLRVLVSKTARDEEVAEALREHATGSVDMTKRPAVMTVYQFKTASKMGPFECTLPRALDSTLRASLRQQKRKWVFVSPKNNEPFQNANSFAHWHNNKLTTWFQGRPITVNSLRHSAATHVLNDPTRSLEDRQRIARAMGHSALQQSRYFYKAVEDKKKTDAW